MIEELNKKINDNILNLEYKSDWDINIDEMKLLRKEYNELLENFEDLSLEIRMKIHHIISLTYYRENNYEDSIKNAKIVSKYAYLIIDEYYFAKSYGWMALNSLILDKIKDFEKYYSKAENIFHKLDKYEDLALLSSRISIVILKKGYRKEGLRQAAENTLMLMENFKSEISSQIYMSIATVYSIGLNDFDFAIEIYSKALEIAREYNIINIEALTLYYIGVGYCELNINSKAIETFNGILQEKRFKDNYVIKATVLLDLISVHIDNRIELHKVEGLIEQCINIISKLDYLKKEQYFVQVTLFKIKYYLVTNNTNNIEMYSMLKSAEKIHNKYGTEFIFSHVDFWLKQLLGKIYFRLGDFENSINAYNIALAISKNYEVKYTIDAYEELANVYNSIGNYKEAFIYMKKANEIHRNIKDSDLVNKYIKVQGNYEKLKDQEKERSDFFATLSHELKTPINIIYSSLQLLNLFKDKDDVDFRRYYLKHEKSVKQNCLRMLKIIENMIDVIKLDTGLMKPNLINYNIVELVEDITMSVLSSVELKGISIVFDTEMEEKIIKCDPNMIERIILNLLSNAIKFSLSKGNIYVNILSEKGYVVIEVADNGIGIPNDMKIRIFNKFEQIDKSLNRKAEGSGIGLSLVKFLVDLHLGFIEVESKVGEGSIFKVYLPDERINEVSKEGLVEKYDVLEERIHTELSDIYY